MSFDFEKINIDDTMLSACLSVCLSVVSHISETTKEIAVKFDTVTASVMRIHHVFISLTLTLI